jgi:AraC-like DNA-binding protein
MEEKQLMDFDVLTLGEGETADEDLQILFVLNGTVSVQMAESILHLGEKDFLILHPFQVYSVKMDKNSLVMRFRANVRMMSEYYDLSKLEFLGNSVEEASERHTILRNLLEKCITYYYGKKGNNGRILLKLNSLYYEIAELLISSFSIVRSQTSDSLEGEEDESLIQEMTRYIHMNYQSALKLEDLAEHFFLSPPYISRFFKKKLGINFAKYLSEVRLEEATKKLTQTENSLTWIAMDCGFPNLTAFNKAFREKYQVSPKQYRTELKQTEQKKEKADKESRALAEFQLLDYFEKNNHIQGQEFDETEQVVADASEYTILEKNWNKMINIGGIYLLLQKEIQDHTLFLCKTLGFEYVRIWDLYETRMHINAGNRERKYNFSRLDICLDFLTQNHIKPYLELGFKPFILLRSYQDYIFNEEREILFEEAREYGIFIRSLIKHVINRYSIQEISSWYFELWCDPRWFPDGEPATYIEYFEEAYQAIKELAPQAHVGGDYDRS